MRVDIFEAQGQRHADSSTLLNPVGARKAGCSHKAVRTKRKNSLTVVFQGAETAEDMMQGIDRDEANEVAERGRSRRSRSKIN